MTCDPSHDSPSAPSEHAPGSAEHPSAAADEPGSPVSSAAMEDSDSSELGESVDEPESPASCTSTDEPDSPVSSADTDELASERSAERLHDAPMPPVSIFPQYQQPPAYPSDELTGSHLRPLGASYHVPGDGNCLWGATYYAAQHSGLATELCAILGCEDTYTDFVEAARAQTYAAISQSGQFETQFILLCESAAVPLKRGNVYDHLPEWQKSIFKHNYDQVVKDYSADLQRRQIHLTKTQREDSLEKEARRQHEDNQRAEPDPTAVMVHFAYMGAVRARASTCAAEMLAAQRWGQWGGPEESAALKQILAQGGIPLVVHMIGLQPRICDLCEARIQHEASCLGCLQRACTQYTERPRSTLVLLCNNTTHFEYMVFAEARQVPQKMHDVRADSTQGEHASEQNGSHHAAPEEANPEADPAPERASRRASQKKRMKKKHKKKHTAKSPNKRSGKTKRRGPYARDAATPRPHKRQRTSGKGSSAAPTPQPPTASPRDLPADMLGSDTRSGSAGHASGCTASPHEAAAARAKSCPPCSRCRTEECVHFDPDIRYASILKPCKQHVCVRASRCM